MTDLESGSRRWKRHRQFARASRLLLLAALIGVGCAAPAAPSLAPTPAAPSGAPEALECETIAQPCSLAEVAPAVLERSRSLGDTVATMLREGGTIADAEAFLKSQDGMAELESDEIVVRFRLEGGRAVWVMTPGAFAPGSRSSGVPAAAELDDPFSLVASYSVVGGNAEAKSAIVLSPFLWDFGDTDDGAAVAAQLEETRGYAGHVTYLANTTMTSTDVGIANFKGWRNDQVVHVSSHGARLCKTSPCRAFIAAGILTGPPAAVPEAGVDFLISTDGRTYIALGADFFRSEYPGGLDETFVFFNACSTYGPKATDLGDTIRGQTSVFLGWTEPVDSVAAQDAATALYASLGRDGFAVDAAYDALGNLQVDATPGGKKARLTVAGPVTGDDLRIREVIAFRTTTGSILSEQDQVPFKGVAGDGLADAVPYQVTVDGMAATTAALATVKVSIDGTAAAPVAVPTGKEVEPGRWSIDGEIDLGYDLKGERAVDFSASVDLPEGGLSTHATPATISVGPVMGGSWSGWATDVGDANGDGSVKVRSRAELTFTYVPGQKGGATHPRYDLTDGTLSWRIDGTSSDGCRVLSPEVTLKTSDFGSDASLVFDLTKDPAAYIMSANVLSGPVVEVAVTCPNKSSTYSTRVSFTFSAAPDPLTVNGDIIAGSYRLGVGEFAWELRRLD